MICIVQARMSSKRLPGKTLLKIKGKSVLERVIYNLSLSRNIKKIIVATSSRNSDKEIIKFCKINNILCNSGPLENVALRFIRTLKKFPCKSFIRISADSPLINYKIIDKMISFSKNKEFDIFTNTFPRSFPRGFSVEIINTTTFKNNYKKFNKLQKEHITTFFYEKFKRFKIINYRSKKNLSKLNFSIDTKKDVINISKFV